MYAYFSSIVAGDLDWITEAGGGLCAKRAALAIKYGGSSPNAVPRPHNIASTRTYKLILLKCNTD